jgi:shikimate 5-dehydrogenase
MSQGYLGFVGVTTGGSSIRRIFPEWADELGLPTRELRGFDVELDASPETYRALVRDLRDDPGAWGALVTTHKMALFAATRDLFDEFDPLALTFGEVSSLAKRDGRLVGSAKDPITARRALEEIVDADHFQRTGGAALVIGAGGAGNALTYQLGIRTDSPSAVIAVGDSTQSLEHAAQLHRRGGIREDLTRYEYVKDPGELDAVLAALPDGSLVVNATGMGKDRPGSPLGDTARFPERAVVWEFNYRGSLEFLAQARAQQERSELTVVDGWRYFIHGWTEVISDVFSIPTPPTTIDRLAAIATGLR